MMRFAFSALGVGLVGNENVYFGALLRFNDHTSALIIIKENELYNDIVNTIIADIKQLWNESADFAAVMNKINRYSKYRILPFSVPYATPNEQITIEQLVIEGKNRCIKFFKEADILIKDTRKEKEAKEEAKKETKEEIIEEETLIK
jgi:hypothetical protein